MIANGDSLDEARRVFNSEINALRKTRDVLGDDFLEVLNSILACQGKVIITGMGKPGHIGRKIAATFASLGTPSFYLHPAEAMHGDLGMVAEDDVVIVISYSGESEEIVGILPSLKMIGAKIIGITSNAESSLAKYADIIQVLPDFDEACYLGLAPTSSTTVELVYGDALAVTASKINGYKDIDFGMRHPAGSLGKKLILKVSDLMAMDERNATIYNHQSLIEAIMELGRKGLGIVSVIDSDSTLLGVITDGDLRRQLVKRADIYNLNVEDVMTDTPISINSDRMAVEALKLMKEKNIASLPVIFDNKVVGTIRLQDIINVGIVG